MPAFTENLVIEQGATFEESWLWQTGIKKLPVNLTGCTARMHIRATVDSTDILLSLTTENGRLILGGTAGTITILLSATTTTSLIFLNAVYDLEIDQIPLGRVKRLMQGTVTVSQEVTR